MLEIRGGAGALSLARRLDPPHSIATAPWINCVKIHVGPGVSHLLVGSRRIDAPEQRRLVTAWKSSQAARRTRPLIVALAPDATELSRLGPHDTLDSHTWARLRDEL